MPALKINKSNLDQLTPPEQPNKQVLYWDTQVKGFGARLTSGGKITFVVQRDVDGKDERSTIGTYGVLSPDQARQRAREMLQKQRDGISLNREKAKAKFQEKRQTTLRQVFDDYKDRGGLRKKTIAIYDRVVAGARDKEGNVTWLGFSDWLEMPMVSITSQMVRERYRQLRDHKGYRSDEQGARAAAAQAMRTLNSLFNYAMQTVRDEQDNPLILSNPVGVLSKTDPNWRKLNDRHEDVLKESDLARWYQGVVQVKALQRRKLEDVRTANAAADAMLLCLFTGLRRGAAFRLTWKNVDWEARTLTIPAVDDKTARVQVLPMSDFVFELLRNRSSQSPIDLVYVFGGAQPKTPLQEPKRIVEQVVQTSGVKFSMHTLRRTFATLAQKRELSLPYAVVKELLHHSRGRDVTAVHYTKIETEDLREPMQLISNYLCSRIGISDASSTKKRGEVKP